MKVVYNFVAANRVRHLFWLQNQNNITRQIILIKIDLIALTNFYYFNFSVCLDFFNFIAYNDCGGCLITHLIAECFATCLKSECFYR